MLLFSDPCLAEWNKKKRWCMNRRVTLKRKPSIYASKNKHFLILFLKNTPGPFTRPEVSDYLGCDHNDVIQNKRYYVEVRLVQTRLSMKPSSSVFRLERAGNNLASDEYSKKLVIYFDNSYSQKYFHYCWPSEYFIGLESGNTF